jgi:hypothetical protein
LQIVEDEDDRLPFAERQPRAADRDDEAEVIARVSCAG